MNRRSFIAAMAAGVSLSSFKSKRKLCFSTLGCPEWAWQKIVSKASEYGYSGIEIRGILDEIDILKSQVFSPANLRGSKAFAMDHGVEIVNLNPSANLHQTDSVKRKANIDQVKRYIDLAAELDCPFVRVFPDKFAYENDQAKSLDLISEGLLELGDYSKGTGVKTLLDTHGDLVKSMDINNVLKRQDSSSVGIIWDYFNMHLKTNESAAFMTETLKRYIDFVQIKDGLFLENQEHKYMLPGKGDVPVSDILDALQTIKYRGFISLEWERRWHPELPDLEIALPLFSDLINTA